ncbi:MAG: ABC transporter permease [Paracoccaceae bacterium]
MSPLNKRRWQNFKQNKRAIYSLFIFSIIFLISVFAEFIANDKPLLIYHNKDFYLPILKNYSESDFGGEFKTEAEYKTIEVECLILSSGMLDECLDNPEEILNKIDKLNLNNWIIWPIIKSSFDTVNYDVEVAPSPPDNNHLLGTDDQTRDVIARIIYGFRLSVFFAFLVTIFSTIIGIGAGAIQGFFGGWIDLIFQRFIEIWTSLPYLYVIIIISAVFPMNFWLLTFIVILFSWTALVGVVRAEFLRVRNFEYIIAARALGVSNLKIIIRHIIPNAMVASITLLPFFITGSIATLATLDFLGFGLPASYPSLGELALQAKNQLNAPWLGISAFLTFTVMLSLQVFIFEGIRDAFDPRKVFV